MANDVQFNLSGVDELRKRLRTLPKTIQGKPARIALRKSANLIVRQAKKNALELDDVTTPERIADNVTAIFSNRHLKRTGDLKFRIGVIGGATQYKDTRENRQQSRVGSTYHTGGETWYWRFLEFGTERMAPKPFLRPAVNQRSEEAIALFGTELDKQITKIVSKLK